MSSGDTIYALSSGAGRAALSVVRLSGALSGRVLAGLADGPALIPRRLTVKNLRVPDTGEVLDRAAVVWLPGPGSYTGEDCAELHVHASDAVLAGLFAVLRGWPGVRLAVAGEFTRRAVANGKMDLVEAEGLCDLLAARTGVQRRQALGQMLGGASSEFDSWRERLLLIRADIEAIVDFADEDGVAEVAGPRIDREIADLVKVMEAALCLAQTASAIRSGVKVVLAGLPNTGKSSLLNAIARRDVALVSAIPGTTRDVIEVGLDIGGVPVLLTDTAGLRDGASDEIEIAGIAKTRREVSASDLNIWVAALDVAGSDVVAPQVRPDIVVLNKSDLKNENLRLFRNDLGRGDVVEVSAKSGAGLDELLAKLSERVKERFLDMEGAVVVTARQREIVEQSIRLLNESLRHDSQALELKAEDVRRAAETIGRLTGRTEVEEWLGAIFSRFCIGK